MDRQHEQGPPKLSATADGEWLDIEGRIFVSDLGVPDRVVISELAIGEDLRGRSSEIERQVPYVAQ
jgi:hypothetical protein